MSGGVLRDDVAQAIFGENEDYRRAYLTDASLRKGDVRLADVLRVVRGGGA
jgi:hypothetical protein